MNITDRMLNAVSRAVENGLKGKPTIYLGRAEWEQFDAWIDAQCRHLPFVAGSGVKMQEAEWCGFPVIEVKVDSHIGVGSRGWNADETNANG